LILRSVITKPERDEGGRLGAKEITLRMPITPVRNEAAGLSKSIKKKTSAGDGSRLASLRRKNGPTQIASSIR